MCREVIAQLADLARTIERKEKGMPIQFFGGVLKNSPQPEFASGFTHEGDMALERIQVDTMGENEVRILLGGKAGQDSNVRELYFRLPRDTANILARAILSANELRVQQIRLQL